MSNSRTKKSSRASDYGWFVRRFGVNQNVMPECRVWNQMLNRCFNAKVAEYARYGGRGIFVCARWTPKGLAEGRRCTSRERRVAFLNFMSDMGRRPSADYSIEREDNNLGYSKTNCVWATATTQGNNKRNNRMLTFRGKTQTAAQWCRELQVSRYAILRRIDVLGWSVDEALAKPVRNDLTHTQIAEIVRRVRAGESRRDVANVFGVTQQTVGRFVRAHGVVRSDR